MQIRWWTKRTIACRLLDSSQAKQYLLCHDCEQRNRNGETRIINHCYHEDNGRFRLRDLLTTAKPILSGPEGGANVTRLAGLSGAGACCGNPECSRPVVIQFSRQSSPWHAESIVANFLRCQCRRQPLLSSYP